MSDTQDLLFSLESQLSNAEKVLQQKQNEVKKLQHELMEARRKTQSAVIYAVTLPRDLSRMRCYKVYSVYNIWRYFERCDAHPWLKCSAQEVASLHTELNLDDLCQAMLKAADGYLYVLLRDT